MIRQAATDGITRLYVHVLLDGRDVERTSALHYVERLEAVLEHLSASGKRRFRIASGGGRMRITMDRYEADWPMVARGWKTHVLGEARGFQAAAAAIQCYRAEKPRHR